MIDVGTKVRIKEPFAVHFPEVYEITSVNPVSGSWRVDVSGEEREFDIIFLEEVI